MSNNTLFFELLTEEIPARMQAMAEGQLKKLVSTFLDEQKLNGHIEEVFSTPRRLGAYITALPDKQADESIEQRGPRVDAPEKAIDGFLRANNASLDDCEKRETKKGTFLFFTKQVKGATLETYAQNLVEYVLNKFSWPTSMRWIRPGLKWVRPLQQIVLLCNDTPLPGEILGTPLKSTTLTHRDLGDGPINVRNFAQYKTDLEKNYVLLRDPRKKKILDELHQLQSQHKAAQRVSDKVLDEMIGLTEYPVMLLGHIKDEYMRLPQELLASSMEQHQRYVPFYDEKGHMMPLFAFAANNVKSPKAENATTVVKGNEKVLNARLSDGSFYWDDDLKLKLYEAKGDSYYGQLQHFVLHNKLGTIQGKVDRIKALAEQINRDLNITDTDTVAATALILKGDLATGVVSEFPELQGIVGTYLAKNEGYPDEVVQAIQDHYKPLGPSDALPSSPLAALMALADKTDSLVGFFAADEKPTGSRDPFSLRRAALGILRILINQKWDMSVDELFLAAYEQYKTVDLKDADAVLDELCDFMYQRFEYYLKDQNYPVWLIRAASHTSLVDESPAQLLTDIQAINASLTDEKMKTLLAVIKRCKNLVPDNFEPSEHWAKDKADEPDEKLLKAYYDMCQKGEQLEELIDMLNLLAELAPQVNDYLDNVTVNAEDPHLKQFRLSLLNEFVLAFNDLLDVQHIEFT